MIGREVFDNIPEEACRELEAIVGAQNMTTDPVIREGYTGRGMDRQIFWFYGASRAPGAVILPKTRDEVIRIVKTCNRFGVPFLPMCTLGMACFAPAFRDDIMIIDLKRMDTMEIDEKNMFAIVEPGVIYAQLQGETLKQGLTSVVPGGGGQVSVLANSFTCGMGLFNYRIDFLVQRRLSGVEWVTPEGEVYRIGSLLAGDDSWYWRDAPGPDAIGLLHGIVSWGGGMGIITRISTKLYPIQSQKPEPEGIGPNTVVKLPPTARWYNVDFSTEESCRKAMSEIERARIGAVINRVPAYWRDLAKSRGDLAFRNDFWQRWNQRTPEEVAKSRVLRVLLIGRASLKQVEYEEGVLTDIVNEAGGTLRPARQVDEATFMAANSVGMWKPTGFFGECDGGIEAPRCIDKTREIYIKKLSNYEHKSDFLDQKGDSPWYMPFVFGRLYYSELHGWPDAGKADPEDPAYQPEIMDRILRWRTSETHKISLETGMKSFFFGQVQPQGLAEPAHQHYSVWIDRFKKEFDPKGLAAPGQPYILDRTYQEHFPEAITDDMRETVKKVEAGPWMGNPE